MSAYLVTYDLNAPGQDYESLIERIKSYGTWANWLFTDESGVGV